ncbi:MAG TPA: hypothetical protein VLW51_00505 [Solirubrobacteraceae bacterium]|nr:hypothetical protein [Solirubrobacteraceae bacterium]
MLKRRKLRLAGMVWKAADVWVQNLTVCNFPGGSGDVGNEIWWNGGDGSGKIGGHGYYGSYLTATSTIFGGEESAAEYGIFSSKWTGGTWDQSYAGNLNDSGYYIGACQDADRELALRQQRGRVRHYPRRKKVVMHRLPKHLATMPNPCAGVPSNPWCWAKQP